jgi:serine/threonine protein kinase
MAEQFPQQFGPYTLQELIARGGMAAVYRATMPGVGGFEKTVAIKKILPHLAENEEFIAMLVDEARIIVSLNHANIAQVYDLGRIDDTYYIAMEYVHAVDLADVLKELKSAGQTVPVHHAAYIAGCICAGLHVAHTKTDEHGRPQYIVHRDVSPHNVLVSFGGDVKIIDFGVAKARGKENHTKAGVIKGKLLYMAPEQAMAKDIDGRADLFAAGLVLYGMLTNHLPFEGDNEFQIYNNILSKDVVPPRVFNPDVPEELNQIVMMLLQRDPDKRYQDGYSAKADLDRCLHALAPGYSVARLSTWIEDNFTKVAIAKRQRRDNPSGRNLPETPAHFNNTGAGAPQAGSLTGGFGANLSGGFPVASQSGGFPLANQSGGFPVASQSGGFPLANQSGGFPLANQSGGFPLAGVSGGFPAANFGGGYQQAVQTGGLPALPGPIGTPSGGFQNPVNGFGSGQFQAMTPAQSGVFPTAAGMAPQPLDDERKKKFPLVPVLAITIIMVLIGLMVFVEMRKRQTDLEQVVIAPMPQIEVKEPVVVEPDPVVVEDDTLAPSTNNEVVAERVTIQMASEPSGATIYLNGDVIGPAPISIPFDVSDEIFVFEARLEGFEFAIHEVTPDVDQEFVFELQPAGNVEEPPTVEPKSTKTERRPSTKVVKKKAQKKPEKDPFSIPILNDRPSGKKSKPDKKESIINPFE